MRCLLAAALATGCYAPNPATGTPCPDGVCPLPLVCSPATHTCERSASDAGGDGRAGDGGIDAAPPTFLYRRRITIQTMVALPTGFTVRLAIGSTLSTLVSQGKARADYADVRVIGDSVGERNRIIDAAPAPVAASFSIAQPVAVGTNTEYALYYGAPAAGPPPASGSAVFALYDDFNTGLASYWLKNDAPTTSSGQLVLRAGHTDALTTTASTDNVPIVSAVELIATVADPNSNPTTQPEGTFWYWFGYQHTGDFSASDPWIVWIARAKSQIHGEQKSPVGCETECDGTILNQDTLPHYYAIERDPNATRFSLDGTLSFTAQVQNTTDYSVMLRNYMATSDLRVDWVRARTRVSPDPTISLGPEEKL